MMQLNSRFIRFLMLAGSIAMSNSFAYAVSTSLFLNNAGGVESIPWFYLLLGLFSLPISYLTSRVIDQISRIRIFQAVMVIAALGLGGVRSLFMMHAPSIYYLLHVGIHLLDLLTGILLWTIVSQYFTLREQERYTPLLSMAMTLGSAVGGVTVRVLTNVVETPDLLLEMIGLQVLLLIQLLFLERFEPELDQSDELCSVPTVFQPSAFWDLLRRYPMIGLFAGTTVLSVLLWGSSEWLFFSVYTEQFPDQTDLAGFLGLLSASSSLLEFCIAYFFTRPLIQRVGLYWMNLAYPMTTLLSFIGLTVSTQLPVAIAANLNYDTLYSSIAQPVQNLNYNTIPQSISGRVRLAMDGLLYPFCQAVMGSLLLIQQSLLTPWQMGAVGIGLSLGFIGVGHQMGCHYAQHHQRVAKR
jgi:ATP/ADP translocase